MRRKTIVYMGAAVLATAAGSMIFLASHRYHSAGPANNSPAHLLWKAPDTNLIPATETGALIRYGRQLIANTSYYLGPKGTVAVISNGLNCQNCHLDAGTRLYGICFASVAVSYPKYRKRSGRVETIAYRINECMQRSLDGKPLDSNSNEMRAMIAYIQWVGSNFREADSKEGTGTLQLSFLNRAADTMAGQQVYKASCIACHGVNGEGKFNDDSTGYVYPPLWGQHSYNVSAGMYRLTRLAAFVKYNMPFKPVAGKISVTDEEAWDVAAYICSKQRPMKFFSYDWKKNPRPFDYPFGPFDDTFPAQQHKYGPFTPMKNEVIKK